MCQPSTNSSPAHPARPRLCHHTPPRAPHHAQTASHQPARRRPLHTHQPHPGPTAASATHRHRLSMTTRATQRTCPRSTPTPGPGIRGSASGLSMPTRASTLPHQARSRGWRSWLSF
ncbi:hypothetical protein FA13DRAFT_1820588 [Coprinellus micaceus]|uniref:Uncharacterized protein n=1 Tax=Coprinellus micaceus TaxID=71717 RepID=A0A4Y7SFK7_COPMI|nr:hypothetical protein FA13DRAFT_1820588 [Coprinellus micaceus]